MSDSTETSSRREALIGYSGFVGSNLAAQHAFTDCFNSSTIEGIRGHSYDLVVSAGAPGVKFLANKEPEADWAAITRLMESLKQISTQRFVLISSLNVYADPRGVTEETPIDPDACSPYGKHRAILEQFVMEQFPNHLIVRLPGIFGPGLKKNVLFDLMTDDDRYLADTHVDSTVQFYDLRHLWSDIQRADAEGIRVLNIATEPMKLMDISRQCFGRDFPGRTDGAVYADDMQTNYGAAWGQTSPYLYSAHAVMADVKTFTSGQPSMIL